jgi:hypothetical protein
MASIASSDCQTSVAFSMSFSPCASMTAFRLSWTSRDMFARPVSG